MNTQTLSSYLRVILRLQDTPTLSHHQIHSATIQHEDDYTIQTHTTDYFFENGVHITCEVEQEWENDGIQDGSVCPPCDITYRVIGNASLNIHPQRKSFKNTCQMHFWIQAHH